VDNGGRQLEKKDCHKLTETHRNGKKLRFKSVRMQELKVQSARSGALHASRKISFAQTYGCCIQKTEEAGWERMMKQQQQRYPAYLATAVRATNGKPQVPTR
jgi:hypothetical protein